MISMMASFRVDSFWHLHVRSEQALGQQLCAKARKEHAKKVARLSRPLVSCFMREVENVYIKEFKKLLDEYLHYYNENKPESR